MKSFVYICTTLMGLLFSLSMQADNRTWKNMSQSEKESYMIQKAQDLLLELDWKTYEKATCHTFSEGITENEDPNLNIPYIRLTFYANNTTQKDRQNYLAYVNFNKEKGLPIEIRLKDGKGYEMIHFGNGYANTKINYKGKLINKDRSRFKDIIDKCLDVIQNFGPDYYRANAEYTIQESNYKEDGLHDFVSKNNGRKLYEVTVQYPTSENENISFENVFPATIFLWQDTGDVLSVKFGIGEEIQFLHIPYEVMKKQKNHIVIPYKVREN